MPSHLLRHSCVARPCAAVLCAALVSAAVFAAAPAMRAAAVRATDVRAMNVRASDARAGLQSRRIVDVVQAGDEKSANDHDAAGEGVTEGTVAGRAFRQASDWLRYSLRTFDDTEVTIACLCRGTEGRRLAFEILIDGQAAGTHTFESPSADPVLKEYRVPEKLTRGKSKLSVTLRGVNGPTPGVLELRTVQEHLE